MDSNYDFDREPKRLCVQHVGFDEDASTLVHGMLLPEAQIGWPDESVDMISNLDPNISSSYHSEMQNLDEMVSDQSGVFSNTFPQTNLALDPFSYLAGISQSNLNLGETEAQGPRAIARADPEWMISGNDNMHQDPESTVRISMPNQFDTCFGTIIADVLATAVNKQDDQVAPVILRPCGDIVRLYFQDSDKYAGLLLQPAICDLLENPDIHVKLSASLIITSSKDSKSTPKTTRSTIDRFTSHEFSVRIVFHGLKSEKVVVSELLSNAGLYLQQPSVSECETGAEYCNPHYLVRPSGRMPELEQSSISSATGFLKPSEMLGEIEKSKILQVFDSLVTFGSHHEIVASSRLRSTLKDHQRTALHMMIEKENGLLENPIFPSIWEVIPQAGTAKEYRHRITNGREKSPRPALGGLLADEMGLGKTLSLLALICSSLDFRGSQMSQVSSKASETTLVVTPKSTVPGWLKQVERHIHAGQLRVEVYHGPNRQRVSTTFKENDIVFTTYETLRSDRLNDGPLYSTEWHRLVLDEAHHICNRRSDTFKAACAVRAHHRWCLTGTPIQNSLDDYGALLSFLNVAPFKDKANFDFWVATPFKKRIANALRSLEDLVRSTCLRRTKRTLEASCKLPSKIERIQMVELNEMDRDLHMFFKEICVRMAEEKSIPKATLRKAGERNDNNILSMISLLRLICDHGSLLLPQKALKAWETRDGNSISWKTMQDCRKRCGTCGVDIDEAECLASNGHNLGCQHYYCSVCASHSDSTSGEGASCTKCNTSSTSKGDQKDFGLIGSSITPSAKVQALLRNLQAEQAVKTSLGPSNPVKSVVFSCWTKMLDLIQQALKNHAFSFERIDGKTSLEARTKALDRFNDDPNCTIMLASIGSAGEGIDLTAANNVHLIEPHWNPMKEAQAVDRIHRIGQEREVTITRYIAAESVETYIQEIQEDKLRLIDQSINSADTSQNEIDEKRWKKFISFLG